MLPGLVNPPPQVPEPDAGHPTDAKRRAFWLAAAICFARKSRRVCSLASLVSSANAQALNGLRITSEVALGDLGVQPGVLENGGLVGRLQAQPVGLALEALHAQPKLLGTSGM